MPTAPLYFQPYIRALWESTQIPVTDPRSGAPAGERTVAELYQQQLTYDVGTDEAGKPAVVPVSAAAIDFDKGRPEQAGVLKQLVIDGFTKVQSELPGADPISRYQIATNAAGSAANRMMTYAAADPTAFEELTPDGLKSAAQKVLAAVPADVQEREVKVTSTPGGTTMDIGQNATGYIEQLVGGKEPLRIDQAGPLAWEFAREAQRTVTPARGANPAPWLESAEAIAASHWAGTTAHVAETMGLSKDFDALEQLATAQREKDVTSESYAAQLRSLGLLLDAAKIDQSKPEDAVRAFQALQAVPGEQMHTGIMQAVLGEAKVPMDRLEEFAGKLVASGGDPTNVQSVLDSVSQAAQPPPPDPEPPGSPPPVEPPPGNAEPPPRRGPRMHPTE